MQPFRYCVFDVETPNAESNRMSAIGITLIDGDRITGSFDTLINPETYFSSFNIALTGISPEHVKNAPTFDQVWERVAPMFHGRILVAHNAVFDLGVLAKCIRAYGISFMEVVPYLCTVRMGRKLLTQLPNHKLDTISAYYGIDLDHHKADSDAHACAEILLRYLDRGTDISDDLHFYDLYNGKTLRRTGALCELQLYHSSNSLPR